MNILHYKNIPGIIEFIIEEKVFHGKLGVLNDLITFSCDNINDIEKIFKETVDEYLEDCKKLNRKPKVPNPGSREAIEFGCQCPIMDNHYGAGYSGPFGVSTPENPIFVMVENCPIHGKKS